MSKNLKQEITFAQTEREQIRELFVKRAQQAPIPNPFDPASMARWLAYVEEMRELERLLREAGDQL